MYGHHKHNHYGLTVIIIGSYLLFINQTVLCKPYPRLSQILEVSPSSVRELPSGTRVCAYWSQQYRCLYPGTVAVSSPDPHHDKFVAVEFDDGDSGRIAIEDIRFLEPNYPIVGKF